MESLLPGVNLKAVKSACFIAALALSLFGCSSPQTGRPSGRLVDIVYTNPVYTASMPDPSVIRSKDWYYAYGTTGGARTEDGRIFTTLRSRDLVSWERLGGALIPPSENRRVQYWAPEVTEHNGVFYLYYSMGGVEDEKFELRVATSPKPEGPFTDVTKLTDCENNRFTIDAFPFKDSDGQWYMYYARNFTNSAPGEASRHRVGGGPPAGHDPPGRRLQSGGSSPVRLDLVRSQSPHERVQCHFQLAHN